MDALKTQQIVKKHVRIHHQTHCCTRRSRTKDGLCPVHLEIPPHEQDVSSPEEGRIMEM